MIATIADATSAVVYPTEQVLAQMHPQGTAAFVPCGWQSVKQRFGAVWLADGSTLGSDREKAQFAKIERLLGRGQEDDDRRSVFPSSGCRLVSS